MLFPLLHSPLSFKMTLCHPVLFHQLVYGSFNPSHCHHTFVFVTTLTFLTLSHIFSHFLDIICLESQTRDMIMFIPLLLMYWGSLGLWYALLHLHLSGVVPPITVRFSLWIRGKYPTNLCVLPGKHVDAWRISDVWINYPTTLTCIRQGSCKAGRTFYAYLHIHPTHLPYPCPVNAFPVFLSWYSSNPFSYHVSVMLILTSQGGSKKAESDQYSIRW